VIFHQFMYSLTDFRHKFNPLLEAFFQEKISEIKPNSPILSELITKIADITLAPGKRIRPALLFYAYQAFGGKSFAGIQNYCLAIELFETFALIHDDIIDCAQKRRGVDTIHSYFTKKFKNASLGQSMAILAGDLALSFADELFYQKKPHHKLSGVYTQMKQDVITGQILDTLGPNSEGEAVMVIKLKTASYSTLAPLAIGAQLAGANSEQIKILQSYGESLGLAFQIQDDILGVFGNEKLLGKSATDDIKEGKKNLLYFTALSSFKNQSKNRFLSLWGKKDLSQKEAQIVRNLIRACGALSKVLKLYSNWKQKTQNCLTSEYFDKDTLSVFKNITDAILNINPHDYAFQSD